MARRKVESVIQLGSWGEVDDALRQIGENTRDIANYQSAHDEHVAELKKEAAKRALPLQERTAMLEMAIREYTDAHRADMGNTKSLRLNHGVVSYRKSTKVSLPRGLDKLAAIISRMRDRGMLECIRQSPPEIDKEALKKYSTEEVEAVGGKLVIKDEWGYDIVSDKIV